MATISSIKQKCLTCSNRVRVVYRFHSLYGKHDRNIEVDFCRFGIPIQELDVRKCEKFVERLNRREVIDKQTNR